LTFCIFCSFACFNSSLQHLQQVESFHRESSTLSQSKSIYPTLQSTGSFIQSNQQIQHEEEEEKEKEKEVSQPSFISCAFSTISKNISLCGNVCKRICFCPFTVCKKINWECASGFFTVALLAFSVFAGLYMVSNTVFSSLRGQYDISENKIPMLSLLISGLFSFAVIIVAVFMKSKAKKTVVYDTATAETLRAFLSRSKDLISAPRLRSRFDNVSDIDWENVFFLSFYPFFSGSE
jgi:hypothetical protein